MIETEVITTEKTREYSLSENDEGNTMPRNFVHALWQYLSTTFYNRHIKKYFI
jgi:hypothetical protein